MSTKIQPDAQIAITQKCVECNGNGTTGMRMWCRNCGHDYTLADWEASRKRDEEAWAKGETTPDTQLCGCSWSYVAEYVAEQEQYCAECEGTGTQHLQISLSELASALGNVLRQKSALRTPTGRTK